MCHTPFVSGSIISSWILDRANIIFASKQIVTQRCLKMSTKGVEPLFRGATVCWPDHLADELNYDRKLTI